MRKLLKTACAAIVLIMLIGMSVACNTVVPELDLDKVEDVFLELAEDLSDDEDVLHSTSVYVVKDRDTYFSGAEALIKEAIILRCMRADIDLEDIFSFENWCGIFECESLDAAKKLYELINLREYEHKKNRLDYLKYMLKNYSEELSRDEEDALEDAIDELEEELQNFVIGRKGVYVWFGNKEYLNATKGK